MLSQPTSITPIPELTVRAAQAAFPKGSTFILMRDSLGTIFADQDFAENSSLGLHRSFFYVRSRIKNEGF